ncbi:MAG: molecular chaperone HtpG [Opitutales bacterium]|nr:molecular chaperone HtpG [Opitutales bacterium]NRA25669.1 molecular chaperone HtpG [Opitutales bacterium]
MSTATPETFSFQAEVQQVLDIVINSLYTDKEIFVRELISNASDATEKLRHLELGEDPVFQSGKDLEISVSFEEDPATITFIDRGIGMTRDELIENLGTIAHSGSKAFLKALQEGGSKNENVIGQFGVGFYSAFMVANKVEVFTRSWREEGDNLVWTSEGAGNYTIEATEDSLDRGTKIIVHLKDDYKEFAKDWKLKEIIKRYSAFVQFPISLGDEKINTVQAIWLRSKSEVTEDEYKEFYKFQANAWDEPSHWLHFNADAPLAINSLLFCPSENPEKLGFGRTEPGVSLYCRKVLIDSKPNGLLPEWLRFLKGVVDSSDIPLNISRESMQDSSLIAKLNQVLTKRYLKHLGDMAKKKEEEYFKFWNTFGVYLKEGIATDFTHREGLGKLLRYESSATEKGKLTSLQAYLDRAKDEQKEIYFLNGKNREAIEAGPYLEAFKARGLEVLYIYEPIDEFVMQHLGQFDEKKLVAGDQKDLELGDAPEAETGEALPEEQATDLTAWIKEALGDQVKEVEVSKRLVDSPAVVLSDDKMMSQQMRQMMQQMGQDANLPEEGVTLQINPRHPLIKNLAACHIDRAEDAKVIVAQIFDNARMAAGLLEDPKDMIARIYKLLENAAK